MDENSLKMCPYCNGTVFQAMVTLPAEITVNEDDSIEIQRQIVKKATYELVKCSGCGKKLTNEDIKTAIKCKECGKMVTPDELDEDGLCLVCHAKKDQPDIFNLSQEDLIRMLLKAQKAKAETMQSVKATTEKANASIQEAVENNDSVAEEQTETEQNEDKPKRVVKKKKQPKEEPQTGEATADDVPASSEPMQEAVNNLINDDPVPVTDGQNAPFPNDLDTLLGNMTPPTEDSSSNAGDSIGMDTFGMFDNSGDRF